MRNQRLKGELNHALHPRITVYRWIVFYIMLSAVLFLIFDFVTSQYRTYRVPSGSVELTVPYVTYLVGEPITFTVKNNFDSPIYIPNECPEEPLSVYKFNGTVWQRIHAKTNLSSCRMSERQIRVASHGTQNGNYEAWPELFREPGKYRIVAYVDYFNVAPYQDFEIITKPEKQKVYVEAPRKTGSNPAMPQQPSATSTPSATPTTPTTGAQPTLSPYSVSTAAGKISVEYSSTYIYVRTVTPASSCIYEGGRSGTAVEVTFKCPGKETQVQLWLSGGQIRQKIE